MTVIIINNAIIVAVITSTVCCHVPGSMGITLHIAIQCYSDPHFTVHETEVLGIVQHNTIRKERCNLKAGLIPETIL